MEDVHLVRIVPAGRQFSVAPDQSVLTAAYAAGVKLPNACRMGNCRTCLGRIVEGEVDHGLSHATYLPTKERDRGYALLCQARPRTDLVIEVEELPLLPDPVAVPSYVKSINRVRKDVAIVRLRLPLHSYTRFAAGQHMEIILPGGERRAYSMANAPEPQGVIDLDLHIRHSPGGLFTDQLFNSMQEREKLQLEGPLGTFFLRDSERPVIFLATGTGYAPIRSMILDAINWGKPRPMTFYWGARTKDDLYLMDEVVEIAAQHEQLTFVPVLSRPRVEDEWTGRVGYVQDLALADIPDPSGHDVYACGSPAMVDAARSAFCSRGLGTDHFFADPFVTEADVLHEG